MLRRVLWLPAFIAMSSILLAGCSTTADFSHTPTDASEFKQNISDLKQKYPDISEYEKKFASPSSAPPKDDLEKRWGEPTKTKKWGVYAINIGISIGLAAAGYAPIAAIGFLINPVPNEEYAWKKGNYEITAQGRNDVFVRYEKRIGKWEWKEKPNTGDIASNAKQEQ